MYSSSKVWVNPRVKENTERQALNHARSKVCRNSPFWSKDFDLKQHRADWVKGEIRRKEQCMAVELAENLQLRFAQGKAKPYKPLLRQPFDGNVFENNRGYVLCHKTIFCPTFDMGKENIAPWPSKAEAKYEGDDRISTDKLHGRFLGAPRVDCDESILWQQRNIIDQFPFDDFYFPLPTDVDVFMRFMCIDDLEFDEELGKEILGNQLFDLLDPVDQW